MQNRRVQRHHALLPEKPLRPRLLSAVAIVLLSLAAGCATRPQMPVEMSAPALADRSARIGIAMTALPTPATYLPGTDCLLCIAAASLANSSLTAHAKTLPNGDLSSLKVALAALVRERGAVPVLIEEPILLDALPDHSSKGENLARKSFAALQRKYTLDKLVLIDVRQLGFERTYSGYIPTSEPKGVVRGTGSLIDLKTNAYDWHLPLNVTRSADGAWDEPPKFPGLSNAYFQVIELGRDELLQAFKP